MELSSGRRRRAPGCGFWLTRGVADLPGRSHGIIRFKCLPSLSDRFGLRVDGRVSLISTQKPLSPSVVASFLPMAVATRAWSPTFGRLKASTDDHDDQREKSLGAGVLPSAEYQCRIRALH